jgi:ssDNA-binding Zn-finger/Zn-ribbon topoisomerase 1
LDYKEWNKQNITKLDAAKKALQMPLKCPKCGGPMKHHLAQKMYKIHGFCFDPCTVEYEAELRKAGLYESMKNL